MTSRPRGPLDPLMRTPSLVLSLLAALAWSCTPAATAERHRERDASRDGGCVESGKPHAYFYAAENRTDYRPDDPFRDGCTLLVADHLFCCPDAKKPTDR